MYTYDVHDDSILCILRQKGDDRFIGIFNFSDSAKTAWMQEKGTFRDLITDQTLELKDVELPAYGFMWCNCCSVNKKDVTLRIDIFLSLTTQ